MPNSYHGEYISSVSGQTGCVKTFASLGQESLSFPPQVMYYCDLCSNKHGFRLTRTHQVATPSQERNFDRYCDINSIEQDVEVPSK